MFRKIEDEEGGFVLEPPSAVGENVKTGKRVFGYDDNTNEQSATHLKSGTICASSGHAMFTPDQVGGACCVCGQLVCTECAKQTCAICGSVMCKTATCSSTIAGQRVCNTHGFFEYARFAFSPSRR